MCAFRNCKVKSDKIILKKDGIIAYKTVEKVGTNCFISKAKRFSWRNGRMTLQPGQFMNRPANGNGPGVYAWKRPPWVNGGYYSGTVVKVLLYGRVIEYASHKGTLHTAQQRAGYMAQRAEILEVL
jgi:hypothetical protein